MKVMNQIAEARASALSLRASAKACSPELGALRFRLVRAAESLDVMVLLAMRGIERIEELEMQLTTATASGNSLTIAEDSALSPRDCELILRALDLLERFIRDEVAKAPNTTEQAPNMEMWSRVLIVRARLQAMLKALGQDGAA